MSNNSSNNNNLNLPVPSGSLREVRGDGIDWNDLDLPPEMFAPEIREVNGWQIARNLPPPPVESRSRRKWPFLDMDVGDSVTIPKADYRKAWAAMHQAELRTGRAFTMQRQPEGVQFYRIA